jgi:hypothetical protein
MLLRARPWWSEFKEGIDKVTGQNVNFIWTQVKKKSIMEQLKCKLGNGEGPRRVERESAGPTRIFPRRLAEEGIAREVE